MGPRRFAQCTAFISGLLTSLMLSPVALAQADQTPRARARALGEQGLDLYDSGQFAAAVTKLDEAYSLYPAPTLGLFSARALVKMGKLLEGSQRYIEVSRLTLDADASEQLQQAKRDAKSEQQQLQQRIPRVRVAIVGARAAEVAVTIDGESLAPNQHAGGRQVNPGKHTVRGLRGSDQVEVQLTLRESESKTATLHFKPRTAGATHQPGTSNPTAAAQADRANTGSSQRTLGWVALSLGGVGLGVGAVAGVMGSSKKSDLEAQCGDITRCPESARSDVDSYNSLRTISTVGFVAGGIGLTAGTLLLLTAPSEQPTSGRTPLQPWVGLGSAGLRGEF